MIKGHVCIDLHNVNSGSTERIEHDNMVTNAVAEILPYQFGYYPNELSYHYGDNRLNQNILPIATKLLGGIMLFDGKLTEDPTHFYFPSEAHLIGFAGTSPDSSHACMGSQNSLESGANERGYTSVWDFNTSQCNGSIASLGLTHNLIYNGLFAESGVRGYNRLAGKFDDKEQLNYYFDSARIRKQRIPNTRFKLNDTIWNTSGDELVEDKGNLNSELSDALATIGNNLAFTVPYYQYYFYGYRIDFHDVAGWYWGYDGNVYLTYFDGHQPKTQIYVQPFKCSDHTFTKTTEEPINVTFESNMNMRDDHRCISNGYLYIISYDNAREVIRVNLSNPIDQHTYTLEKPADLISALPYGGAKVYYTGNYDANKACDILYPDGETRNFADKGQGAYSMWGCGGYLGTICNLGSAIEKTSAQTMKITYTLTDEDEPEETTETGTEAST